eukprot:NODE_977_length_1079_cov_141.560924_g933_i0.p1 GENE.NODE_977_length_1079_cov_141.560924_g933_i0~~NODE_977_length_1079_cov_141.560924_g933_i0.p1  ORF type:complete len:299 (+),score=14.36 NODE_977_length_1079_cov_141.560924_g933_i0:126-1022(+)
MDRPLEDIIRENRGRGRGNRGRGRGASISRGRGRGISVTTSRAPQVGRAPRGRGGFTRGGLQAPKRVGRPASKPIVVTKIITTPASTRSSARRSAPVVTRARSAPTSNVRVEQRQSVSNGWTHDKFTERSVRVMPSAGRATSQNDAWTHDKFDGVRRPGQARVTRSNNVSTQSNAWSHDAYFGTSSSTQSLPRSSAKSFSTCVKLIVSALPSATLKADIQDLFEEFPNYESVEMVYGDTTQAIVTYHNAAHANAAVQALDGVLYAGRPVRVRKENTGEVYVARQTSAVTRLGPLFDRT